MTEIYDDELSTSIEGSSLMFLFDTKATDIVEMLVKPNEVIEENIKIKITNLNILGNKALNKTINGLTFEVNEDRSITINGTATADTEYVINGSLDNTNALFFFKENKNYRQYGLSNGAKINLYSFDGTDRTLVSSIDNGTINLSSTAYITYVTLSIANGSVFKDVTVFPMITVGTYSSTNPAYIPCEENELLTIDLQGYKFTGDDTISINRDMSLFTKNIYLYPSDNLYPSDDLYPIDYDIELYEMVETQRTFEDRTIIQCDKDVSINIKYFAKDYLNEKFSKIEVKQDEINLEVSKKVGNDEIISRINQTAEAITIDANRININGTVSANGNFKIDTAGNMECANATINGGNVTINDSSSSYGASKFKISGSSTKGYMSSIALEMYHDDLSSGVALAIDGIQGGNQIFAYSPDGSVGIGFGEIWADGNIYGANISSDRRLKENIIESDINAIDVIKKMKIKSFDWKESKKHINAGYIAQEMEEIDQNFVLKKPILDEEGQIIDYKYYINELPIVATLTKAIQEQQEIIEQLQKEIKELKEVK